MLVATACNAAYMAATVPDLCLQIHVQVCRCKPCAHECIVCIMQYDQAFTNRIWHGSGVKLALPATEHTWHPGQDLHPHT